jgi:hypothetical protein
MGMPLLSQPGREIVNFHAFDLLPIGTKLFLNGFHVEISHGIFWMMMAIIAVPGASLVYRDY